MITNKLIQLLLIISLATNLKAQMVEGFDIPGFGNTFGIDVEKENFEVKAVLKHTSLIGNILWPTEMAKFEVQLQNNTDNKKIVKGKFVVIQYATKGRPGDIWTPEMFKINEVASIPINTTIESNGYSNITVSPKIPETYGAYALIADLGKNERQFVTTFVRTFAFEDQKIQYPSFCLDELNPQLLRRLGVHAIRHGIEYNPTTNPDFELWYQKETKILKEYNEAGIVVLAKMGAGASAGEYLPMGTIRPWLDDSAKMMNTKSDYAWKPQYDDDFKKLVYRLATEFGWPKGPINAFALWNEPWEGISISGWGADIPRYREIYSKMAEAVFEARQNAGVDILVGGCSSTSNALDKLFPEGGGTFLDRFDFCSIHYQGLTPYSTLKLFVDRQNPRGRVKIWDTESWVANTDDRVAAVVATNRSAGYDRAMGIYRGNISENKKSIIRTPDGNIAYNYTNAWSVAASIGAVQHFIGERTFNEILFKKGLPWINVFNGLNNNPDDGTLVIIGDIGEEFGADIVLHRTARGLNEIAHEQQLYQQIAALDAVKDADKIKKLQEDIDKFEVLSGAEMIIDNTNNDFSLFDFYGNKVESNGNKIIVPLNMRGYFLRTNGKPGTFAKLINAVNKSKITGIEPLETIIHDFINPINNGAKLHVTLTNVLNQPVTGNLNITISNLTVNNTNNKLSFQPFETKELYLDVTGKPTIDNTYALKLKFDAGNDGQAFETENIHVNYIANKKIEVDGKLDDWSGSIPQPIISEDAMGQSLTEAAWFSFMKTDQKVGAGYSNGYLAYDSSYFYFSAKVSDNTPDAGMRRFDGGDEEYCFYPDTCYKKDATTEYSIHFTGKIKPKYTNKYVFSTLSDDGVRLWVNNKLLIDNFTYHGPTTDFGAIDLEAGKLYDIKLDFFQGGGGATAKLFWESKQQVRELVPTSCLFSESNNSTTGNGLDAEMFMGMNFEKFIVKTIEAQVNIHHDESETPNPAFSKQPIQTLVWPKGIRKFSYRMNPEVPAGNFSRHDNIQIAFNVLSDDEKASYPFPPGTMPQYTNYQCTDYEYALNPVSNEFGGGTEVYRIRYPKMPFKHHYPRQPKVDLDGAVKDAKLVIVRDSNMRVVELAIPWHEIPHVKAKLNKGETIKFSYRVNDDTDRGCMELSRLRSVAKRNSDSFQVNWIEHWANELEFGFEKK